MYVLTNAIALYLHSSGVCYTRSIPSGATVIGPRYTTGEPARKEILSRFHDLMVVDLLIRLVVKTLEKCTSTGHFVILRLLESNYRWVCTVFIVKQMLTDNNLVSINI